MKKTVLTSALLMSLMFINISVFAQRHNGEKRDGEQRRDKIEKMIEILDLNESQVDQIKSLHTQKITDIKPIKNELREKEARLITVSTVTQPNKKEVAKVVNEISSLRSEIFMIKSMNKLEVRSLLNEEQKLKFDQMKSHKKKGKRA